MTPPHDSEPGRGRSAPLAGILDAFRLDALAATKLMDSAAEESFDRLTRLLRESLGAPTALISLVDDHRQFFKSAVGLDEPWASRRETPLSYSFCQYAVSTKAPLVVDDARHDPLLRDNRAVSELGVVAYAGVPLVSREQHALGAICVVAPEPRRWSERDVAVLRAIGWLVEREIDRHVDRQRWSERDRLFEAVFEHAATGFLLTDATGKILRTNAELRRMLGYAEEELAGRDLASIKHPDHVEGDLALRYELLTGRRQGVEIETRFQKRDGGWRWTRLTASLVRDDAGDPLFTIASVKDIEEERETKLVLADKTLALTRSEERYRALLRNLPNTSVFVFDHDLRIVLADGEALMRSAGMSKAQIEGRTVQEVASPQNVEALTRTYRAVLAGEANAGEATRDGRTYAYHAGPIQDEQGGVLAGMVLSYDVTRLKSVEAELREKTRELERSRALLEEHARQAQALSLTDELTGLYNRRGFLALARHELSIAEGSGKQGALFFVDLNGMKGINDQLGHEEGDRALGAAAQLLRATFGAGSVVARLGGDEFVALATGVTPEEQAERCRDLQAKVQAWNREEHRRFRLSLSVGVAPWDPASGHSIEDLLAEADKRMYEQKNLRRQTGISIPPPPVVR